MKLTPGQILALGGVAVVGFLAFRFVRAAGRAVQAAGAAVRGAVDLADPTSSGNVFARVNDGLTRLATGDPGTSFGSNLFDLVQRIRGIPPFDPNAPVDDQDGAARAMQNGKPRPQIPTTDPIVPARIDLRRTFIR